MQCIGSESTKERQTHKPECKRASPFVCILSVILQNREYRFSLVSHRYISWICDREILILYIERSWVIADMHYKMYADKRCRWQFPCAQFEKVKIATFVYFFLHIAIKQSKIVHNAIKHQCCMHACSHSILISMGKYWYFFFVFVFGRCLLQLVRALFSVQK